MRQIFVGILWRLEDADRRTEQAAQSLILAACCSASRIISVCLTDSASGYRSSTADVIPVIITPNSQLIKHLTAAKSKQNTPCCINTHYRAVSSTLNQTTQISQQLFLFQNKHVLRSLESSKLTPCYALPLTIYRRSIRYDCAVLENMKHNVSPRLISEWIWIWR